MNQFVKTLIKKYKDPSIIGERSAEEVIHYLKQKFIIKDIKQSISDDQMKEYDKLAAKLGMDVLVEIHDEEEMERVLKIHPKIIGVNNRNLKDFTISLENTKRLRPMVPEGTVFVSESGVTTKEHIAFLKECKVDALLIGGAFMLSEHPKELAADWKALYDKN